MGSKAMPAKTAVSSPGNDPNKDENTPANMAATQYARPATTPAKYLVSGFGSLSSEIAMLAVIDERLTPDPPKPEPSKDKKPPK
jgi:hypothetical protein